MKKEEALERCLVSYRNYVARKGEDITNDFHRVNMERMSLFFEAGYLTGKFHGAQERISETGVLVSVFLVAVLTATITYVVVVMSYQSSV